MAITVRVRNVQSIKDETVVIDGFTVITGPNNSGKTALMRAIRGVFTNAAPGPLVRHGEAHLIVDIDFGDGNTVRWEKGWEKPTRKGKTVNRYTVNGKLLENVGKAVPDEVMALGVQRIQAGTSQLWPQVADQFHGVLFLIGSPGSAMAEAIADVDRVGKLSDALKLSESDRRKVTSKLELRRKDVESLEGQMDAFEGLDDVGAAVSSVEGVLADAEAARNGILDLDRLRRQRASAHGRVDRLSGVREVVVPSESQARGAKGVRDDLRQAVDLRRRLVGCREEVARLEGVRDVPVPDDGADAVAARGDLRGLRELRRRREVAQATIGRLSGVQEVTLPAVSLPKLRAVRSAVVFFQDLSERRRQAEANVQRLKRELRDAERAHGGSVIEVDELIDKMGVCPTCRKAADGHTHGGAA